jgi:hypothetical protein
LHSKEEEVLAKANAANYSAKSALKKRLEKDPKY